MWGKVRVVRLVSTFLWLSHIVWFFSISVVVYLIFIYLRGCLWSLIRHLWNSVVFLVLQDRIIINLLCLWLYYLVVMFDEQTDFACWAQNVSPATSRFWHETFDKCPVEAWLKAVALWSVALGTGPWGHSHWFGSQHEQTAHSRKYVSLKGSRMKWKYTFSENIFLFNKMWRKLNKNNSAIWIQD